MLRRATPRRVTWYHKDGRCVDKLERTMEVISKWSISGLILRLVCLWTPPIFYASVFLPCWSAMPRRPAATGPGAQGPVRAAWEVGRARGTASHGRR